MQFDTDKLNGGNRTAPIMLLCPVYPQSEEHSTKNRWSDGIETNASIRSVRGAHGIWTFAEVYLMFAWRAITSKKYLGHDVSGHLRDCLRSLEDIHVGVWYQTRGLDNRQASGSAETGWRRSWRDGGARRPSKQRQHVTRGLQPMLMLRIENVAVQDKK